MSQYTKYKLYKLQQRISGSSDTWIDVVPTTYSYDGNGTQTPVIVEEQSADCGYVPPIEPIYRWVTISINQDYVCDECPIYRTLTTATTCVGVDKYELDEYQVSYDSGTTWTTTATSATTLIEADSEDCGYVPPTPIVGTKLYATYSDNTSYSAECESENDSLIYGDTNPSGYMSSRMTSAVIGECVSSLNFSTSSSYGSYGTFQQFISLSSVTIPNSVTSIGDYAFNSCSGLTRINSDVDGVFNIPSGVTIIGKYAFAHCQMLKHIVFPNTVNYMEIGTVTSSNNLESVTILATTPPDTDSWESPLDVYCPIYVPSESVNAYKTAKGWRGYSNYIQAIPNS